jgi:hypothetical protein
MLGACRELQHSVLEEEGLSFALDVETDLGSVSVQDSSSGVKNGHPKMMGEFSSPLVSITTKYTGTYELPTHTYMSSKIPLV